MKKLALAALAVGALSLSAACGGDDDNGIVLPDASGGSDSSTSGVCNAIMNSGCDAGEKCAVRFIEDDTTTPGTTECMTNGTVAIGGACAFAPDPDNAGTTRDDCMAPAGQGVFCRSRVCTEACAGGVAGSCPARGASPQACVLLSRVYDDQATPTGVCALQCDPTEKSTCPTEGEGCYFLSSNEFICANSAVDPDNSPTAGQPCPTDAPGGGCFLNGAPPGSMIIALNADVQGSIGVIAPYCRPANTTVDDGQLIAEAAANGEDGALNLAGDPIECVAGNLAAGEIISGTNIPAFQCRFFQSAFQDADVVPIGFGFCAGANGNNNGATGWRQATVWSLTAFAADAADNGQIDDEANRVPFGAVDVATLDAALARVPNGRAGYGKYMAKNPLPKMPVEMRKALEAKMGVTLDELRAAKAAGQSIKVNPNN